MASTDTNKGAAHPLEARLGHHFANRVLFERALTHRSIARGDDPSYERLEFLGDRVLGLVIADMLMRRFKAEPEGALSKRLNALVRRETLAEIARDLDLAPHIRAAGGETQGTGGVTDSEAVLSDVVEALIGAIYRDAGLEVAARFIEIHWDPRLAAAKAPPKDAKSALQEWAMARGLPLPAYETLNASGPDHAPVFEIAVSVAGYPPAHASGSTKRGASQAAAGLLLDRLTEGEE